MKELVSGRTLLACSILVSRLFSREQLLASECSIPAFAEARTFGVGKQPFFVTTGDLNSDGHIDLAVANKDSNDVSVLLGNADGTFQQAVNYVVGLSPTSAAAADFNADGRLDLAVVNFWSSNVSILSGNGDGTFRSGGNFATGSTPYGVAVADFNGDGKADLAVSNNSATAPDNDGSVSVLLGGGDGTFQPAVNYSTGYGPHGIVAGDLNGDGHADLIVALDSSRFPGGVAILLGEGDGTFQPRIQRDTAGESSGSVAIGDLNGDGKLDLAVLSLYPTTLSVLFGQGDGTFPSEINYALDSIPSAVAVNDFDCDGRTDLAVLLGPTPFGNFDVGVRVFAGTGAGHFQAGANFPAGKFPWSMAQGDFNGDGKVDLAVANRGDGQPSWNGSSISVLLNTTVADDCLTIGVAPGGISIAWPLSSTRFILESATNLFLPDWQPVAEAPMTNDRRLELTSPADQPQRYFRLRKP